MRRSHGDKNHGHSTVLLIPMRRPRALHLRTFLLISKNNSSWDSPVPPMGGPGPLPFSRRHHDLESAGSQALQAFPRIVPRHHVQPLFRARACTASSRSVPLPAALPGPHTSNISVLARHIARQLITRHLSLSLSLPQPPLGSPGSPPLSTPYLPSSPVCNTAVQDLLPSLMPSVPHQYVARRSNTNKLATGTSS